MSKKRLLFVGDFCSPTGFATVNEAVLTRLDQDYWQKPYVLAINHNGDPHPLGDRFFLYPAMSAPDTDAYGIARFPGMVADIKPDLIFTHQDAWIIAMYLKAAKMDDVKLPPVVAWCPPDAENQSAGVRLTGKVKHLLTPSEFGQRALQKGGYEGDATVVRYAVDHKLFRPIDQRQARTAIGLPDQAMDAFLFGRADRNAVRKRYDISIMAFGQWWRDSGQPDAYLYLHCAPRDVGYDLVQLCKYFKLGTETHPRVIFTSLHMKPTVTLMPKREILPLIYSAWDAHLSTAMGEGGGLVALESAACGVPQILPRSSSLAEWFDNAAEFIDPSGYFVHTGGINTVGRVVSIEDTITAMDRVYRDAGRRGELKLQALQRAATFQWDDVGTQVNDILRRVVEG